MYTEQMYTTFLLSESNYFYPRFQNLKYLLCVGDTWWTRKQNMRNRIQKAVTLGGQESETLQK